MKIKIAIVEPFRHYDTVKRAEFIADVLRKQSIVDIFLFSRNKKEILPSFIGQLRLLYKIAMNEYQVIFFMNIDWIVPPLIKIVSRRKCVVVYDASNIQFGIAQTLGKNICIRTIVKIIEWSFVNWSDYISTMGVSFYNFFSEHYSRTERIFFVSNPIGIDNYSKLVENKGILCNNFQFSEKITVVYTSVFGMISVMGQYVPRGWELIEAISSKSNDLYEHVTIHFVGTGNAIDDLLKLAEERGVLENCIFKGFLPIDEFVKEISSADIGFMEDYSTIGYMYTVGSKVQEYMAAALPVITGSSPEKLYMLKDQKIPELLFSPPNFISALDRDNYIKQLQSALRYALEHRKDVRKAGERNRLRAERILSNSVVEKMLNGLFNKVIRAEINKRGKIYDNQY